MARHWAAAGRRLVMIGSDSNHLAPGLRLSQARVDTEIDGVRCIWLRTRKYTKTASVARVISWLDFEWRLLRLRTKDLPRPDVILVSSLSLLTILNGLRLRKRYGSKLVFEVRDIWPLTLVEEGGFSRWHPLSLFLAWLERIAYRTSNLVVGTMPNLSPHASRIAGRPIEAACVPFGFEPDVVATHAERAVPTIERDSPEQLIIGYAGSMGVTNALHTIVNVANELRDDRRFKFVLLGDGDLRAAFQRRTEGCRNVVWVGRVPRMDVTAYLQQCDLLYFAVHDSKVWDSGMSLNKLTDYLLAAKPVIASYSGFPSILNEAGCGEFLPSNDEDALRSALVRYQTMPAGQRAAMGEAGRRWLFERRTWRTLAQEYLDLLDGVAR